MGYTFPANDGFETFATAYWDVAQVNLAKASKTGTITFISYKDQASKGKRQLQNKQYSIAPADFDKYFATTVLDNANTDPYAQAYVFANSSYDTTRPDASGKPVPQAFFNGATVVQPGLPADGTTVSAIQPTS